jgi:hypothetical protein
MARADRHALLLADRASFDGAARRARIVRLTLAVLVLAATFGAFLVAPRTPGRKFLPADTTGIVVLDVSSSVKPSTYFRIEQTLATIAATQSRLGLVLFSDVAYEAFPSGTAAAELKPLLRFFAPPTGRVGEAGRARSDSVGSVVLRGTKISNGLLLACGCSTSSTRSARR